MLAFEKPVWWEKARLTYPEIEAVANSEALHHSGRSASFSPSWPTRRQKQALITGCISGGLNTFNFWVLSTELINNITAVHWLLYIDWKGGSDGLVLKKIISFTNQANFPKVSMGWSFITRDGGLDQGQGRPFCWGVIFRLGSITWGVILIISWKYYRAVTSVNWN